MNMNKYERLNQQKKYRSEKSFSGKKRVAAYCRCFDREGGAGAVF